MAVHYSKIYDPAENEDHRVAKWVDTSSYSGDKSEGYWEQFCGYGRGVDKDLFRDSINARHPVWANEDYDKEKNNEVYAMLHPNLPLRRIIFADTCLTKIIGEDMDKEAREEEIDAQDRENRVSRNFSNILCDYAEKCVPNEKKVFFKAGGRGMKWTSKCELMKKIGLRVEEVNVLMEDPDYSLNLSDVSVRNYPKSIFNSFYERYTEWIDSEDDRDKFNLNVGAKEFVPGEQWMPLLSRSSTKKICGAYAIDPLPPKGKPEKKRPPSDVSSEAQLCWAIKNDSDEKLKAIEKKLEWLIGMNGPVVKAKAV